ncbi:MAG: hypothetical protein LUD03_03105 [Firmicutes bacterium]|nr:hypothetical protein [Bacillota bacterium]
MATKNIDVEALRDRYAKERIDYIALRPAGTSEKVKDVTVTINGYNYKVMYGKRVKIPRFVAEVLERAYSEAERIDDRITDITRESRLIAEM